MIFRIATKNFTYATTKIRQKQFNLISEFNRYRLSALQSTVAFPQKSFILKQHLKKYRNKKSEKS